MPVSTRVRFATGGLQPFVPAGVQPRLALETPAPALGLRYRVRDLDGGLMRELGGSPALRPPVPMVRTVLNAVSTFVVVLLAGLMVAATAPWLLGYRPVVVTSGSMEPTIQVADVVVTSPSNGHGLGEGAVISHDNDGVDRMHRIAAVTDDGYRTIGDANRTADSGIVTAAEVNGVGVVVVPFVGLPRIWLDHGQWVPLGLTLVLLVSALHMSRLRWVDPRPDPYRR